jgi:hypothetical protein
MSRPSSSAAAAVTGHGTDRKTQRGDACEAGGSTPTSNTTSTTDRLVSGEPGVFERKRSARDENGPSIRCTTIAARPAAASWSALSEQQRSQASQSRERAATAQDRSASGDLSGAWPAGAAPTARTTCCRIRLECG